MKSMIAAGLAVLAAAMVSMITATTAVAETATTPEQDRVALQRYYAGMLPGVKPDDFVTGSVALDPALRTQWEDIMQFPPFTFAVDHGKDLFQQPLADGKHYADCFDNGGIGIRQTYPRFDEKTGQVVTLESAINACRVEHGDKPLAPERGDLAAISAYMASTSEGKRFDVKVPDDPRALAAYEDGKRVFYARRGQLNFSCASCHVQLAGKHLRLQVVSPALGMVSQFPIYRSSWGEMGTLDRRFSECFEQVRAMPLPAQSEEYRNLEYFLTYMSNGLPVAGPGAQP